MDYTAHYSSPIGDITMASDGKAIGSLSKDATCTIVAAENGWYKIKFDKGYGYVSSDYVKLVTN